jgi:hypothetical protein
MACEFFVSATCPAFPTYIPRHIKNKPCLVTLPSRTIPDVPSTPSVCISEILAVPSTELLCERVVGACRRSDKICNFPGPY